MDNCVFCSIAKGEIPAKVVYEDASCIAFYDLNPQAKVHVLVMPKQHLESLHQAEKEQELLGHLLNACTIVAETLGLADGYRVVTNIGVNGRQSVKHLHFHVLGGELLSEELN